jgi:3-hydroxymyristoyl/3-hydroxydecanoyl-(acyl carrier protein) dehydratase
MRDVIVMMKNVSSKFFIFQGEYYVDKIIIYQEKIIKVV